MNDPIMLRSVLAEEIGHYFTTIGNHIPSENMTYNEMLLIEKQENKASKWSTDYLIPTKSLLDCFSVDEYITWAELSRLFQVTEELIKHKLTFMSRELLQWYISDNRVLCLTTLPLLTVGRVFDIDALDEIVISTERILKWHTP